MSTSKPLTDRQAALLERVCLRRYTVVFYHYMGTHRPNDSVRIDDEQGDYDRTFRPATVESLRARGLVRYVSQGPGWSHIKPTQAGLDHYRANLDRIR
jgi:hypothetical protein